MSGQKAAGLLIFRKLNGPIEYLFLQTSYGINHWTPPKGHVDEGESEWDAALRETKEEAGLGESDLEIYKDIFHTLSYPVKGELKSVTYWAARLRDPEKAATLSKEHQDQKWVKLGEAQKLSGFEAMQDMLAGLHDRIRAKLDGV